MSLYCADINSDLLEKNGTMVNTSGIPLYEYSSYLKLVKTTLKKNSKTYLINDEECISYIVYNTICGHMRYDDSKGFSKIENYLIYCIISAIKSWETRAYLQDKPEISLDFEFSNNVKNVSLKDTLEDKKRDFTCTKDFDNILKKSGISEKEKTCITMKIVENKTFDEIGQFFNFSKQAAQQVYKRGLENVKKYVLSTK